MRVGPSLMTGILIKRETHGDPQGRPGEDRKRRVLLPQTRINSGLPATTGARPGRTDSSEPQGEQGPAHTLISNL